MSGQLFPETLNERFHAARLEEVKSRALECSLSCIGFGKQLLRGYVVTALSALNNRSVKLCV